MRRSNKMMVWWVAVLVGVSGGCADESPPETNGDDVGDPSKDDEGRPSTDSQSWPCPVPEEATTRQYRVTAMQLVSPPSLSTASMQAIVDTSLDDMRFLWLLELDEEAGTLVNQPGYTGTVPPTTDEEFCRVWRHPHFPTQTVASVSINDGVMGTNEPLQQLLVPIFGKRSERVPEVTLPIQQVELEGLTLSADGRFIGLPAAPAGSTHHASTWQTAGSMSGWISVEEAKTVEIASIGAALTLCGVLAGQGSLNCQAPQEQWQHQPEPIPGSNEQGYRFQAELGAGAITIQE
jgi:hypothetical protein